MFAIRGVFAIRVSFQNEKTLTDIATIWNAIERELGVHAPAVLPTLNGPATDRDIERLESTIGYSIPHDVRESLKLHNGQDDPSRLHLLCEAGTLLSVDRILEVWEMITEIDRVLSDQIPDRAGVEWWNPAYLPISDFEGDYLCVNLLAHDFGEVLWHVHDNGIEHCVFASYTDWLQFVASVFTEKRFAVDDGYLDFWIDSKST